MYGPARDYRVPRRSRQRSRAQSDPGHPYISPPYAIPWPAPARRPTDPGMGMNGSPYQQSHSHSSSVERLDDPFTPPPGSLLAQYQQSGSPAGTTPSPPVSPRSPSPQRSGHQRSPSRHGSFRTPQGGPLIKDVPQPPRTALNTPSVTTLPHPHSASSGQVAGYPSPARNSPLPYSPSPFQGAAMQQGSYQQPYASVNQNTSATHLSHHQSLSHHPSQSQHHTHTHHRSRSRPPSAASHRYASSITPPVYGHGSSATFSGSRTSLNGDNNTSQRHHHAMSPPPASNRTVTSSTASPPPPSGLHYRSRSNPRVPPPPSSTTGTGTGTSTTTSPPTRHETVHKLKVPHHPPPEPPRPAKDIYRTTDRRPLPANYDGRTQTRYVNMLLALDDISPLFNILASFFTWILLAGFVLFPGTFASWKSEPAGTPQSDILSLVNHVQLYVIAWICTGIGSSGMIWLWWRWQNNYIWITNRIFIPGLLNSVAGVISTLSSIYGAQGGQLGRTEESTIIVTGSIAAICGVLVLVYEFWFIRNLRLEHDAQVGVEKAGKHGEGVTGEKQARRRDEV